MENYNDEIQLKDILIKLSEYKVFLFKKKVAIIVFSFLFFIIGLLYAFNSNNQYNAELTFVVEVETGGSLAGLSGIAGQFGFDIGSASDEGVFSQSNVIELLKSRGVIVSALMKSARVNNEIELLIEHYLGINKIKEDWDERGFKEVSFYDKSTYIHDSISGIIWLNIIENNLSIEIRSEANIITLSYISSNEEFAKEFVENLINEMSKMYITHQTAQANNTLDFLQDRADSVFAELQIVEQEFARVKDINARIIKASGRLKELQLMRQVEVLNAMYLEIVKNLEISKLTLLNKTPIINIIDKPILPLPDNKSSSILIALLAGFLGAFLSSCYFIVIKLFNDALADS